MSSHYTHKKRKSTTPSIAEPEWNEGIELVDLRKVVNTLIKEREPLQRPFDSSGMPDMMKPGERQRLAIALYEGNYMESMQRLRDQNMGLVVVLRSQLVNSSPSTEQSQLKADHHIDGILLDICRSQNIHKIPVLTAATSLLGECNHLAREYHDVCAIFHRGEVLSEKWVRDFLIEARTWRPPSKVIMLNGVAVAVFDNLSMKVDYSSYSTEGATGYSLHMTNWLSTRVPKFLAPTMDARKLCAFTLLSNRTLEHNPALQ
jgi:hypothetical protein